MASGAFRVMATAIYSTKRNVTSTEVVHGPVVVLASVHGTPLMPVDQETIERYHIQSPRQPFVIYFEGSPDILIGDYVTYNAIDYPVRGVGPWPTNNAFLEVMVDIVK